MNKSVIFYITKISTSIIKMICTEVGVINWKVKYRFIFSEKYMKEKLFYYIYHMY